MKKNFKILILSFFVLLPTEVTISQVIITEVDSINALAYGNARKLVVGMNGVVSLVFHNKSQIYYTESDDNGLNWLTPINLSFNSGASQFPSLAIDSLARKHIVWQDNTIPDDPDQFDDKIRIYYKNFIDLNDIPERFAIPIGESVGNSLSPAIAVDSDGKLYAAWAAFMGLTLGWEINYSEGTVIGSGFTGSYDWSFPEIPGNGLGIGSSFFPSIDIAGDILFIAWLEENPFLQLVNLIKFRQDNMWSEHFSLSDEAIGPFSSSNAGIPSIVVDQNIVVHAVFQEILAVQNNTFNDIFYLDYRAGDTLTFGRGQNISQTESASTNPMITSDIDKKLFVVWEQRTGNQTDIFISRRGSDGSFSTENLSQTEENSFLPQIASIGNDSLLVVWLEGDVPPYRMMAQKIEALVTNVKDVRRDNFDLSQFQLFQNYPNPFNANTLINYYLPYATDIEVFVSNVTGQIVKNLLKGGESNGYQTIWWDGTDNNGFLVSSGIYIITLKSKERLRSIQAVLLK